MDAISTNLVPKFHVRVILVAAGLLSLVDFMRRGIQNRKNFG